MSCCGHDRQTGTQLRQGLGGVARCLSGPHDRAGAPCQISQPLPDVAGGDGTEALADAAQLGAVSDAPAQPDRPAEDVGQGGAGRSHVPGQGVGTPHLAEHLGFPDDPGVEAAGHPEQVLDGLQAIHDLDVRDVGRQEAGQDGRNTMDRVRRGALGGEVDLRPLARAEDRQLADAGPLGLEHRPLGQLVVGEPGPEIGGGGPVGDQCEDHVRNVVGSTEVGAAQRGRSMFTCPPGRGRRRTPRRPGSDRSPGGPHRRA